MIEVGANREWFGAQASLKFLMVKFLGLRWLPHYDDWYEIVLNAKRSDTQSPRGHGKTTFWSFAVPIWDAVRGNASDLLVSYSEDQVRRLIRNIKIEIETNPFFAPIRPSTKEIWGTDMLTFADAGVIQGLGFGTSARGLHPRRIVGDDVLKDLGGMSQEDQERAWYGIITGMAMTDTQIHVVGTPIEFGDLLEKLEQNPVYTHWKKPAINDDGSPLCPELFTIDTLTMRQQEMGTLNFAREFLLQRIDPATQPFKRDYETIYAEVPANIARTVTVCDPAYSATDGDATAIVTVSFTHGNHAYVRDAREVRRDEPGRIVDECFKVIEAYNPDAFGIEKRKGEAVSYSFEERMTREERWGDFEYVELSHGGASKGNRVRMAGGLVPRWEGRSVHVHKSQTRLLNELYAFRLDNSTKGHDDLVDALAYCFHKDMARPNTGKKRARIPQNESSKVGLYGCGRGAARPIVTSRLNYGAMLDRRVGDAA